MPQLIGQLIKVSRSAGTFQPPGSQDSISYDNLTYRVLETSGDVVEVKIKADQPQPQEAVGEVVEWGVTVPKDIRLGYSLGADARVSL